MVVPQALQDVSLPQNLPFKIISRTIGQGAYAFIRKACPPTASNPVVAVKFIHKRHAYELGRVKPKQIQTEIALHSHVVGHQNIIRFLGSGEDEVWTWIAMELADGDLFDKVEADEGLPEDAAHLYFTQLVSAVSYMHAKDVAHRDIKPENILLQDGNMKLADFGLAVLFRHKGQKKLCQTVCGSPPYMAPEIIAQRTEKTGYHAPNSDVWSCAVVLFVLFVGNTPWDEATLASEEYSEYLESGPIDELWQRIPHEAISLLRGMLRSDPEKRFTLEDVRHHPWFTRSNRQISSNGTIADPLGLATDMLGRLNINLNQKPTASSQGSAMDIDLSQRLVSTQPEVPITDMLSDWERPARLVANENFTASQPAHGAQPDIPYMAMSGLMDDPVFSQFSSTAGVPLSLTQRARYFKDIVPSHSLTMFFSFWELPLLLQLLSEALSNLGIFIPPWPQSVLSGQERAAARIRTKDQRHCSLDGTLTVHRFNDELWDVRFNKQRGDPVEWRRMFKKVTVLCKDCILKPDT